jgi:hypothetical protein
MSHPPVRALAHHRRGPVRAEVLVSTTTVGTSLHVRSRGRHYFDYGYCLISLVRYCMIFHITRQREMKPYIYSWNHHFAFFPPYGRNSSPPPLKVPEHPKKSETETFDRRRDRQIIRATTPVSRRYFVQGRDGALCGSATMDLSFSPLRAFLLVLSLEGFLKD